LADNIIFNATVSKVQTLPDFGLRVTFDLSENDIMQAAMLMTCKKMGVVLEIEARPLDQNSTPTPDGKKSRPPAKSLRGG
jgi:hypothetical protein